MASVRSLVAVVKTKPESVLEDYGRVMHLAGYQNTVSPAGDTLLKLNLSWTQYFPACSTEPWQLEGVVRTLLEDGYARERLFPVENKTVVTNPRKGCKNNLWEPILDRYGLTFQPLPEVEWTVYKFQSPLLKLNDIFPEGIEIPKMYIGRSIIHFPTVKTHGHSITTGAIKNAFGGLLKEVRHYAHKYIHEVMVDLVMMQKEIHPGVFAVMDGTVAGDGAGPRTMFPRIKNYILASADSVAIDAVAAKMMGFAPMEIPYLRMCHERGLGVADPREIEVVGEDVLERELRLRDQAELRDLGRPDAAQGAAAAFSRRSRCTRRWSSGRRWPRTSTTTFSGTRRSAGNGSGSSARPSGAGSSSATGPRARSADRSPSRRWQREPRCRE